MNKVKVSIIVPVYNTEKYLRECLDSLVNQTLKEIQIVIVDDGSKDRSPEIIAEYKESYPDKILVITKENGGQGIARNIAFSHCTGEYIGFLDSDDYARRDMFERMYQKAKEEGLDCVACGFMSFCIKNGKMKILEPYYASPEVEKTRDMFLGVCASSCLHLVKADVLKDKGIRYTEGVIYEDTSFFAKLIPYLNTIGYIREAFVLRRMRANSTITNISKDRVLQMHTVMDDINEFFEKRTLTDYSELKECFCVRILLCSHIERVCLVKSKKERKAIVSEILAYIDKNYPDFKNNPYFKGGMKNFYIKHANKTTVGIMCEMMRIKKKMGKKYV